MGLKKWWNKQRNKIRKSSQTAYKSHKQTERTNRRNNTVTSNNDKVRPKSQPKIQTSKPTYKGGSSSGSGGSRGKGTNKTNVSQQTQNRGESRPQSNNTWQAYLSKQKAQSSAQKANDARKAYETAYQEKVRKQREKREADAKKRREALGKAGKAASDKAKGINALGTTVGTQSATYGDDFNKSKIKSVDNKKGTYNVSYKNAGELARGGRLGKTKVDKKAIKPPSDFSITDASIAPIYGDGEIKAPFANPERVVVGHAPLSVVKTYSENQAKSKAKDAKKKANDALDAEIKKIKDSGGLVNEDAVKQVRKDIDKESDKYQKDYYKSLVNESKSSAEQSLEEWKKKQKGKVTEKDMTMEKYNRLQVGSRIGGEMGTKALGKDLAEQVGNLTAINANKNSISRFSHNFMLGAAQADTNFGGVGTYSEDAKKLLQESKESKAGMLGYGAGAMAGYMLTGGAGSMGKGIVAGIGEKAAKSLLVDSLMTGARGLSKEAAERVVAKMAAKPNGIKLIEEALEKRGVDVAQTAAKTTGGKIAKNAVANTLGALPMDVTDAVKMARDENGNIDPKSFALYLGLNSVAFSGGMSAGMDAVSTGMTRTLGKKTIRLQEKANAGIATPKELEQLDKNLDKLYTQKNDIYAPNSNAASEAYTGTLVKKEEAKLAKRLGDRGVSPDSVQTILSEQNVRDYINLKAAETTRGLSKQEQKALAETQAKIALQRIKYEKVLDDVVKETKLSMSSASAIDAARARKAFKYYTATGNKAKAKEAEKVAEHAEWNVRNNVNKISKAAAKLSNDLGRDFNVMSQQEIIESATKDGINVIDPTQFHGYVNVDSKTGQVIDYHVNMDSEQAIEYSFGHELTHGLESLGKKYDDFVSALKEFVGDEGWTKEMDAVKERYGGLAESRGMSQEAADKMYNSETVANLVGQHLFSGDDRLLKSMLNEKPSLFQELYRIIKGLLTGTLENDKQLKALSKQMEDMLGELSAKDRSALTSSVEIKDKHTKMLFGGEGAIVDGIEAPYRVPSDVEIREKIEPIDAMYGNVISELNNAKHAFANDPEAMKAAREKIRRQLLEDLDFRLQYAKQRLEKAEKNYANDYNKLSDARTQIFEDTGWFKGLDGKWEVLIDDRNMKFTQPVKIKPDAPKEMVWFNTANNRMETNEAAYNAAHDRILVINKKVKNKNTKKADRESLKKEAKRLIEQRKIYDAAVSDSGVPIGDLIDHEILYLLYPDMKDGINVKITDKEKEGMRKTTKAAYLRGVAGQEKAKLFINPSMLCEQSDIARRLAEKNVALNVDRKVSIIHELQHSLQNREGLSGGGSPENFKGVSLGSTPAYKHVYPKVYDRDRGKLADIVFQRQINGNKLKKAEASNGLKEGKAEKAYWTYIENNATAGGDGQDGAENIIADILFDHPNADGSTLKTLYIDYAIDDLKTFAHVQTDKIEKELKDFIGNDFDAIQLSETDTYKLYGQLSGEYEANRAGNMAYKDGDKERLREISGERTYLKEQLQKINKTAFNDIQKADSLYAKALKEIDPEKAKKTMTKDEFVDAAYNKLLASYNPITNPLAMAYRAGKQTEDIVKQLLGTEYEKAGLSWYGRLKNGTELSKTYPIEPNQNIRYKGNLPAGSDKNAIKNQFVTEANKASNDILDKMHPQRATKNDTGLANPRTDVERIDSDTKLSQGDTRTEAQKAFDEWNPSEEELNRYADMAAGMEQDAKAFWDGMDAIASESKEPQKLVGKQREKIQSQTIGGKTLTDEQVDSFADVQKKIYDLTKDAGLYVPKNGKETVKQFKEKYGVDDSVGIMRIRRSEEAKNGKKVYKINELYDELSKDYPSMFPESIKEESDRIARIMEVVNLKGGVKKGSRGSYYIPKNRSFEQNDKWLSNANKKTVQPKTTKAKKVSAETDNWRPTEQMLEEDRQIGRDAMSVDAHEWESEPPVATPKAAPKQTVPTPKEEGFRKGWTRPVREDELPYEGEFPTTESKKMNREVTRDASTERDKDYWVDDDAERERWEAENLKPQESPKEAKGETVQQQPTEKTAKPQEKPSEQPKEKATEPKKSTETIDDFDDYNFDGTRKTPEQKAEEAKKPNKDDPKTIAQELENAKNGYISTKEMGEHAKKLGEHWSSETEVTNQAFRNAAKKGEIGGKKIRVEQYDEALEKADRAVEENFGKVFDRVMNREDGIVETVTSAAEKHALMKYLLAKAGAGDEKAAMLHLKLIDKLDSAGSLAGHMLQLQSYILRNSPHGRLRYMLREIKRMNKEFEHVLKGKELSLTEDEARAILNAKDEGEAAKIIEEIGKRLWKEVPSTPIEAMNQIRHWAMLFNPKTHGRNMGGNAVFLGAREISDTMETFATRLAQKTSKGKRLLGDDAIMSKSVTRQEKQECKDILNERFETDYLIHEQRADRWAEGKRTAGYLNENTKFKAVNKAAKIMNKLIDVNYNLLDREDRLFFRPAYRQEYIRYCKSKGFTESVNGKQVVTANSLEKMTDAQKKAATSWAMQKAKVATFRDDSAISKWLIKCKNATETAGTTPHGKAMYRGLNVGMESILPFVKTPVNILRRGADYSPIGLTRGVIGSVAAKDADAFMNSIHQLSTGLTGTGVFVLGWWAASHDWVTVEAGEKSGDEYYDRELGYQDYSMKILGQKYSVSMDWMAPMQFSFFQGAAVNNEKGGEWDSEKFLNILGASVKPMMEMSFMSSAKDSVESFMERAYRDGTGAEASTAQALGRTLFGKMPQGWLGSFVPQLVSQTAGFTDDKARDTSATNRDELKKSWVSWGRQMENRIPGLRETLNPKLNRKGEDVSNEGQNILTKFANAFANPANVKKITLDKYDEELIDIHNKMDEGRQKSFFFMNFTGNPTLDLANGKRMTYDEKYKYGKASRTEQWDGVKRMIDAPSYGGMTDKMKQEEVDDYHWLGNMAGDYTTYGVNYALKVMKNGSNSRDESDTKTYKLYTENAGKDKDKEKFWQWRMDKERLLARAHSDTEDTYRLKGLAAVQSGDDNLVASCVLKGSKEADIRTYWDEVTKKFGKKAKDQAFEEMTDASCRVMSNIEDAGVGSSLGMKSASAGKVAVDGKQIEERVYRAYGHFWNSAQAGGGLMLKYNTDGQYDLKNLESLEYKLDRELEKRPDGVKEKEVVMNFIENELGVTDQDEAACLYQTLYLKGNGKRWKNPYKSEIYDHLKWGENNDETEDSGKGGRRYGRRGYGHGGGRGRGGSGGSGGTPASWEDYKSKTETPKAASTKTASAPQTSYGRGSGTGRGGYGTGNTMATAPKFKKTNATAKDFTYESLLNDAYRKKLKKQLEDAKKH